MMAHCTYFTSSSTLEVVLRLDLRKLDDLCGKILWYFSFVELIHILLVLILIFSQAAVSVVPLC